MNVESLWVLRYSCALATAIALCCAGHATAYYFPYGIGIYDPIFGTCVDLYYHTDNCDDEYYASDEEPTGPTAATVSQPSSPTTSDGTSSASGSLYSRFLGKDYIPSGAIAGLVPKSVSVKDLGTGSLVDNIEDCEAECEATPTCNAAAYLATVLVSTGKNCYIKGLDVDTCELPADADDIPDVTLSLKCEDDNLSGAPSTNMSAVAPTPQPAGAAAGSGANTANSPSSAAPPSGSQTDTRTTPGGPSPSAAADGSESGARVPSATSSSSSSSGRCIAPIAGGSVAAAVLILVDAV